jgi:hypothetical protein
MRQSHKTLVAMGLLLAQNCQFVDQQENWYTPMLHHSKQVFDPCPSEKSLDLHTVMQVV